MTAPTRTRDPLHSALVGLTSLGVLLQAVWAGAFLRDGGRDPDWVTVHQWGAGVTLLLGVAAAGVAVARLQHRSDLLVGTLLLAALLAVEYVLGLQASDGGAAATVVHVPLAMALMGIAVWLPLKARTG